MRTIGGIIFGYLGDRFCRRQALMLAVLLVTIPTFIMGVLPVYDKIGLLAPLIVIICRLLQGLCTSGEYSGASILIAEYSSDKRRGFACSLLPSSSLTGAVLGTALGALFMLELMPTWAWRIPFILGGVFGLVGFYLRRTMVESPDFTRVKAEHKLVKIPLLDIIKTNWRSFL